MCESTIWKSCGSGLLTLGLNAVSHAVLCNTAWLTLGLINGKKHWKRVSLQKVVTLNNCCDVASCLLHIQIAIYHSRLFSAPQHLEKNKISSIR